MRTAIYPGSFDPITNGHVNLIKRGLSLVDELIVAVSVNVRKKSLFSPQERMEMIRGALDGETRVKIETFDGLLVDYCRTRGARIILRGLRAISDFEFEFQMAHMNRKLAGDVETVFMMTGEEHFYVSSSLVREIAHFGGSVKGLVPPHVETRLIERCRQGADR